MSDPLATYLHDHVSGANAAIDLICAMRERQKNKPLGEFMSRLLAQVEADRNTVQQLAHKIGAGSNLLKELTGKLGEKATRMKLGQSSGNEFGTFEALEFLALGVRGKMGLWLALQAAAGSDERLSGYDFQRLAKSAEMQYEEIENQRLELAKTALRPAD